jgi:hypothetical protein
MCTDCSERPVDVVSSGLCMRCYKRQWRLAHGVKPQQPQPGSCSVEGCEGGGRYVQGMCRKHHTRWKKYGDPKAIFATERGTVPVETVVFNGITFRRYPESKNPAHQRYFKPGGYWIQRGVQALHQEVWKAHNGPIPDGFHVHHKDGDAANNDISNLECISSARHQVEHAEERSVRGRSPKQLAHLEAIRPLAAEWHRSEAGREWHRQHGLRQRSGTRVQPDDE